MTTRFMAAGLCIAVLTALPSALALQARRTTSAQSRIPTGNASSLYSRDVGQGAPIIVLHGGPDFETSYLLPDLDRLSDSYRLIYYDQRGRGKSADRVTPEEITLSSDLDRTADDGSPQSLH